jgi:seryl-tRNA synthetase
MAPCAPSGDSPAQRLHDELVRHGLLFSLGVKGAFGYSGTFEQILELFDRRISASARHDGAETRAFPPIVSRHVIERHGYLDSFPHLCGSVFSFSGNESQSRDMARRAAAGESWSEFQAMTDVALTPAICYPLYPTLSGPIPAAGRLFSLLGWAYRHEPSDEPTRMRSFRMREFVQVGTSEQVSAWRDMWLRRSLKLLTDLGLDARTDIASDPFFGRSGRLLAANQKEQRLKYEILIPITSANMPTAVCSFNLHRDYFGSKWQIRTENGEPAHTACLGFGLERVVIALLHTHGFDPGTWPAPVRALLWPADRAVAR